MYIKELRIRNFRSIIKADISLNNISVFVGQNDVGKSNVLKALNLFFNNETDPNTPLNFIEDYCKLTPIKKKKAQEIVIELVLQAPSNYKDAEDVIWKKIWRKGGLHDETKSFLNGSQFPRKSKIPAWIQNIKYIYIPAIRGGSYFQILLAKLHDTLVDTIEEELRVAGEGFINKIKSNTKGMISGIEKRLKIKSEIRLPSNLQELFKTLDFNTTEGEFSISLSNRGNGIKTRHIPVILKFISDQFNSNRIKGSPNISMIWGYEEPENNLEMSIAFKLAEEFIDYSNDIQLLLTTHSPGFYSIKSHEPQSTNLYRVSKRPKQEAKLALIEGGNQQIDDEMGLMPIIAPYVDEKLKEIKNLELEIGSYQNKLSSLTKNTLFVEGLDEIRIYSKLIEWENLDGKIVVKQDAFGCSGVKQQLMAWSWVSNNTQLRALGLFDKDTSGISEYNKLISEPEFNSAQSNKKVKALIIKVPSHLHKIVQNFGTFPIELEEMYSPSIWRHSKDMGWLEERSSSEISSFIKPDNIKQSIDDKITSIGFSPDELLYLCFKIPDKHKEKVSKFVCGQAKPDFYQSVSGIKSMFDTIIKPFLKE